MTVSTDKQKSAVDSQLWRLTIKSSESESREESIDLCLKEGLCATGWGNDDIPHLGTKNDYLRNASPEWEGKRGWKSSSRIMMDRMRVGDFVWMRDLSGTYYVGQITSNFFCLNKDEYNRLNLRMSRRCMWLKVGTEEKVPGAVIRSTTQPNSISKIPNKEATIYSDFLYAKIGGKQPTLKISSVESVFGLLSPDVLEDIVAYYLSTMGWFVIPSTCKRQTALTEFILVNKNRDTAMVQVKSGKQKFEPPTEYPECSVFFVFEEGNDESLPTGYKRISSNTIQNLVLKECPAIPRLLQEFIKFNTT